MKQGINTNLLSNSKMQHHALYDAKCNCEGWILGLKTLE